MTVCDEFDRADGALGDGYAMPPAPLNDSREWVPFTIVDGHVEWVGAAVGGVVPRPVGAARVTVPIDGAQTIELVVSNLPADVYLEFELFCSLSDADPLTCIGAYWQLFRASDTDDGLLFSNGFYNDFFEDDTEYWGEYTTSGVGLIGDTVTLRLEMDADLTCRAFYNGELMYAGVADGTSVPSSPFVGFAATRYDDPGPGPFIESVCHAEGGITRKSSWVSGWRTGEATGEVAWSDVNTGVLDVQSAQAVIVIETLDPTEASAESDADLVIGGIDTAYTGPIYSAGAWTGTDPNGGVPIWTFDPGGGFP